MIELTDQLWAWRENTREVAVDLRTRALAVDTHPDAMGSHLSELEFNGVPVASHMLLGQHLSVTRRGMWGAIKTFNSMRVQVSALAVGTALAIWEYVAEHRGEVSRAARAELDVAWARVEAARQLMLEKWTRDVHGFEFMEGTSNIQRIHVAQGFRTGEADAGG